MKITWDIAKLKETYGTEKSPSKKTFVIPGQDNATKTDNKKVTWSADQIKDIYQPSKK